MAGQRALLAPHLDLTQCPQSRVGAYARTEKKRGTLGNGFLEVKVDFASQGQVGGTLLNKVTQERHRIRFTPFEARCREGCVGFDDAKVGKVQARGSVDVASLTVHLAFDAFDAELSYVLNRGEHFVRKLILIHNVRQERFIETVSVLKHRVSSDHQAILHEGGMFYPVAFLRSRKGSLFFAVDFIGSFAAVENGNFSFEYHPACALKPGGSFQVHTVVVGVAAHAGRTRVNPYHEGAAELDVGEQQWFREFLLQGAQVSHPPYLEMKAPDPGLEGPSELEVIEQCRWFGATHVFLPRTLKAPESAPALDSLNEHLSEGGVSAALVVSRRQAPHLGWVALGPDGGPASPDYGACFACHDFRDHQIERYLTMMDTHGFTNIEVGGSPLVPCHSAGHDHAPGLPSLHAAFEGLVEVTAALRENAGHVRCARPYACYGAGLARIADSVSFTAPDHPLPLPDIHPARLFADMGRLYFRRSHSFLLPHTMIANSVGCAPESCPDAPYPGAEHYPWYLYHDGAGWRYALISAIATGSRHRLYALSQDMPAEDRAFAVKWFEWERRHMHQFRHVEEILDDPGLGKVDGYVYATPRGATVFLFNCTYDRQDVRLQLDLEHDADYVVRELYPKEFNYLGPNDGLFRRDSAIPIAMGPREARIVEAVRRSPASVRRKRPEVFGVPSVETQGGIAVTGDPGQRLSVGVRVRGTFKAHEVRLPGNSWTRHLLNWTVATRGFEEGLDAMPDGAFSGKPFSKEMVACHNAWLCAKVHVPAGLNDYVDRDPFVLQRPCWSYARRMFFVVRFEPPSAFDPIRTGSGHCGVPEGYASPLPMKCGIDLTTMNLGLHAWINGQECPVYPALAAWNGYAPNPHPIVSYFFEAGSKLDFGYRNQVVLFARSFEPSAFRGVYVEHPPGFQAKKVLELS
ncbi:MAG: hypothetical protein GY851_36090 [bacterium]|nr:hypothetical protein [bacterium]